MGLLGFKELTWPHFSTQLPKGGTQSQENQWFWPKWTPNYEFSKIKHTPSHRSISSKSFSKRIYDSKRDGKKHQHMALVLQHWAWEKWPPKQNNQDDISYLDTIFSTIWKKRGSYGLFKSNLATLKLDAPDADSLLHSFRIPPNMWLPLWLPLCH